MFYLKTAIKSIIVITLLLVGVSPAFSQTENELLKKVKAKLDRVNDYQASGRMKLDVSFINAPASKVTVYFKKPNRFKVKKSGGISILPKGGVSVNANSLMVNDDYIAVPAGNEKVNGVDTKVIKLLPNDENGDVVLTKLYVDEKAEVIRKAVVTTRESGTYQIEMEYGKLINWGLPDKVLFTFNTKDYKLPKGVTFEYEKGGEKKAPEKMKNKKGTVEITYSSYVINKGVPDDVFK